MERTVADIGAKTAAAKNTIAAVTSLAPHAIASHAKKVGAFFDAQSNKLLQFPNEKNQLLQVSSIALPITYSKLCHYLFVLMKV